MATTTELLKPGVATRVLRSIYTFCVCMLVLGGIPKLANGQILMTGPVTTDFNGTGAALPTGWRMSTSVTQATNLTTPIGSPTLNLAFTTGILNGMAITGTNIPVGATVSGAPTANQVTMSLNATAVVPSITNFVFSGGSGVAGIFPSYTSGSVSTAPATHTGLSVAGNGYQFTSTGGASNDRAFGYQSSATFAANQSMMVAYTNNASAAITGMTVSFTVERYRINTGLTSGNAVSFYSSTDGVNWTSVPAGNIAFSEFPSGAAAFTFADGTQTKVTRTAVSLGALSIAPASTIYLRWQFITSNSTANSQGLALDDVTATPSYPACVAPVNQPSGIGFSTIGTNQMTVGYTAAVGATEYLAVRYPTGAAVTAPTDGVLPAVGSALGLGTVAYAGSALSFVSTGLTLNTTYDYYIYAYNSAGCTGGPLYNFTTPLTGTQASAGCPSFAATVAIDPVASVVSGSSYQSLTGLMLDLSGCPISQPTVIALQSGYVGAGETYPIVLSNIAGTSATNTITIRPAVTGLSITNLTVGAPTIDIAGGRYWIIDGRVNGVGTTPDLIVQNTENVATFSAAIRLQLGAQNNVVTYTNVRSSNPGVGGSLSILGGGNNSNNTVSFSRFGASPAGTPSVGIGSVGTISANNNNSILNNEIFNYHTPTGNSYGIYISDFATNWNISGNSIYQTATRQTTSGADRNFAGIYISPGTASTVFGLIITGNYIGGTAPFCGGTPLTITDNGTGSVVFRGIYANVGTGAATSIQSNTIQNIAVSSSSTSTNQALITAFSGNVNIGNINTNTLGGTTAGTAVTFTGTTSSTAPRFSGILAGTGSAGTIGAINITGNTIYGITVNSTLGGVNLAGIHTTNDAPTYTIANNLIGTTTGSGGLTNASTVPAATNDTWGIFAGGTVSNAVTGNTITNLSSGGTRLLNIRADAGSNTLSGNTISGSTSASGALTGCIGIWMSSTTAGQTITQNQIHSLSNTNTSATNGANGIYYQGPTAGTNVISRNLVHSLRLSTTATAAGIYGIRMLTGAFPATIQNNMVRLGVNAAGADINTGYLIHGISNASSAAVNVYFNSVHIGGAAVTGTTTNTFALSSTSTGNVRDFRNNVLSNTRSGGTTGKHYALTVGTDNTTLTNNNNLYYAPGSNGFLALYNGVDYDDMPSVRTAMGQDLNSASCDPKFIAPDGNAATVDLHISATAPTLVEAKGVAIGSVTTDYDGQARAGLTPTDIGADAGNFVADVNGCSIVWGGSTGDWSIASNWTTNSLPTSATPVVITGGTPTLSTGTVTVASLTMSGPSNLSIASGATVSVAGALSSTNSASITGNGKLSLSGTGAQAVTGVVNVANLEIANTSVAGVTIPSGSSVNVVSNGGTTGNLTFITGGRLTNSGSLTLKSNALGTANMGNMTGATFIGNLTQERKVPNTPGWYFVGAPIASVPLTQWSEMGVRIAPKNNANIFEYTEPDTTRGSFNGTLVEVNGWKVPGSTGNNINPLNSVKGYRLYMSNSFLTGLGGVLSVTGTPIMGNLNHNITRSTAGFGGGGWNLTANPYPCEIDLNTVFADNTSISPLAQIWNTNWSGGASYSTWTGIGGTNGGSQFLPSSQAYFVRAINTSSVVSYNENQKDLTHAGTFLRSGLAANTVRMTLATGTFSDQALVGFRSYGNNGADRFDADKLNGTNLNLSTLPMAGLNYVANVMGDLTQEVVIPIRVGTNQVGQHTLSFEGLDGFDVGTVVSIRDNFTNTVVDLGITQAYAFSVTSNPATKGDNRLSLVVRPAGVTATKATLTTGLSVWPNPTQATREVNLQVSNGTAGAAVVMLIDMVGKVAYSQEVTLSDEATKLNFNSVAPGMYTVRVVNERLALSQSLLIK